MQNKRLVLHLKKLHSLYVKSQLVCMKKLYADKLVILPKKTGNSFKKTVFISAAL